MLVHDIHDPALHVARHRGVPDRCLVDRGIDDEDALLGRVEPRVGNQRGGEVVHGGIERLHVRRGQPGRRPFRHLRLRGGAGAEQGGSRGRRG